MAQLKGRKIMIEIPLSSRPKRVFGPSLPPPTVTLLPPRDSTAYIVSKLVLPSGLETDKTTRRRLYYTIGWTDIPAAKVSICASRILDYVSPRELEDWEYNDFLTQEEGKRQAELDAVRDLLNKPRKRPGRPRKEAGPGAAAREAELHLPEEEEAVLHSQEDGALASKPAGGPSLSTPSKRKLEDLLRDETEAEDTTESETAIHRQLYGEEATEGDDDIDEPGYPEMMDVDSDAVDVIAPQPSASVSAGDGGSTRASSLAPPPHFRKPSPGLPSRQESAAFSSLVSTPGGSRPTSRGGLLPPAPVSSVPQPSVQARQPKQVSSQREPSQSAFTGPRQGPKPRSRGATPRISPQFPTPSANGFATVRRESIGFTPVPIRSPSKPTPTPTTAVISSTLPASSFASSNPSTTTPNRSRKKRKREKPAAQQEETEEAWEVRGLEGDKYDYDLDGNLVRYFKVRWEGDWPEWQNPSWEPEENISETLKQDYLLKQEKKMKNGYLTGGSPGQKAKAPLQTPNRPPPWLPKKRYSNVAEAFEGGMDELAGRKGEEDEDDGGMDERLLVTDEPQKVRTPGSSFSTFDQKLARYRNVFGSSGH